MNSKRLYYILVGLVGVMAIGLLGGAYGANVVLQSQSQKVINARSKSTALEQQLQQIAKAKTDIAKYKEIATIARNIVPQDKDQAQTVREIVKIASANGISLGAITFPTSTLGTGKVAVNSGPNLSQLIPAPGISGVYTLELTVQSVSSTSIPYDKFINFLAGLEHNRRTALVGAITITPDTADTTKISFSLTIDEYIKP